MKEVFKMLDIKLIRENPEKINELLKRTTSRSAFYCRSDPIHFRLDILS